MVEESSRFSIGAWWGGLTFEQHVSVSILGLCCVVALGLSFFQFKRQLAEPFLVPKSKLAASQQFFADQAAQAQQIENMKKKDTDGDGLSDYDEQYVYHTSPYLADSDSDTIPDAIEMAQGTDPNCPQGKTCFQIANDVPSANASSSFGDFLNIVPVPTTEVGAAIGASSSLSGAQSFLQQPPDPSTLSAPQIRQYLLANQLVSQEQLNQLSDSAVKDVYTGAYEQALRIRQSAGNAIPGFTFPAEAVSSSYLLKPLPPTPILDQSP